MELMDELTKQLKKRKKAQAGDGHLSARQVMQNAVWQITNGQDDDLDAITDVTFRSEYVLKMRECFEGTIIRRTRYSVDLNGNAINGLKERQVIDFYVTMSPKEQSAFERIIERTRETM